MKKNTKIALVVILLVLGGLTVWKWQMKKNEPVIDIINTDNAAKEVKFEMTYKDMKFGTTMKHGGIRSQVIKGYTFEGITQGNTIVFSIKSEDGKVLATQTVSFNG